MLQIVVILAISSTVAFAVNAVRRDGLRLFNAGKWLRRRLWVERARIDLAEAKRHCDGSTSLFVDARTLGAYRRGHIRGAVWCPVRCLDDEAYGGLLAMVPKGGGIIAYCDSTGCRISDHLAWELHTRGAGSVAVFRGGWQEWSRASCPTEVGPSARWSPPCEPADPLDAYEISLEESKRLFDSQAALFVDCRSPRDFKRGHIPRAHNLPLPQYTLAKVKAILDYRSAPDAPVVAYCDSSGCGESRAVVRKLVGDKVTHLKILTGGWAEWVKAGYPKAQGR